MKIIIVIATGLSQMTPLTQLFSQVPVFVESFREWLVRIGINPNVTHQDLIAATDTVTNLWHGFLALAGSAVEPIAHIISTST